MNLPLDTWESLIRTLSPCLWPLSTNHSMSLLLKITVKQFRIRSPPDQQTSFDLAGEVFALIYLAAFALPVLPGPQFRESHFQFVCSSVLGERICDLSCCRCWERGSGRWWIWLSIGVVLISRFFVTAAVSERASARLGLLASLGWR